MSTIAEPNPSAFPNPVALYLAATRPAFLSVTFVGCLLGLASAHFGAVPIESVTAIVTVVFALLAHAGVNVLNDYFDAQNGTDAANTERVFPFTGGSRFIQNRVLTQRATGWFGFLLLAAVVPAGLWLAWSSGPALVGIGLLGLIVGWAYSAPPLQLVSRGLGEIAITGAWVLVVVGTDFVQRHALSFTPFAAGLGFALLVANVLYINQFPDMKADALAGKRTVVVRLGAPAARYGYGLLAAMCGLWIIAMVMAGALPTWALVSLLPLGCSAMALTVLWANASRPSGLVVGIKMTILAAVAHGVVLAVVLMLT